ncbi:MAG: 1-deoxy-D-xylulose-5-phosphate reductoisomerase [Lachnospiraceae bacterium]|nr:1-deoxy-D-xylulose-5-phosphate reductoisomerase [Lachnospiraceae bacterium]
MKQISILGSTGSIGTQTLEVVRENPDLSVTALAAGRNAELLEAQAREFRPRLVSLQDERAAGELKIRLADTDIRVLSGMDGLLAAATEQEAQVVVTAVVGMIGIRPTIAAIEAGKDIALANKETLVTAGHLIMPLAKEKGVRILPVDSEHSAIFQCLNGERGNRLAKILLTASGGPFRGKSKAELKTVRLEDALKHPNWSMGHKITIDSSTLVNKGLEVMEAKWLFGVGVDDVQVVVQPQSIIHSMVQFEDGAVMAQLGVPDMKLPIEYALFYPERRQMSGERLDFWSLGSLDFEAPDFENFPGLAMAYAAGRTGGTMPTVFNAANEWAVAAFLGGKIAYPDITAIIGESMARHITKQNPDLEEILLTETEVYRSLHSEWV